MRSIAHVSDLHFGRHDPDVVSGLATDIAQAQVDLVVVSGDLTQRARSREFAAALQFLSSLSCPFVAVPGNHDIPLYNPLRRLGSPFSAYLRHFGDPMPRHFDAELAVLGFNTAVGFTWKGGLVRHSQVAALREWARQAGPRLRVVFAHHPFSVAPSGGHSLVRRSALAIQAMEMEGVDLLLTGHHHMAGHSESRAFAVGGPRRLVIVQAGTATSHRMRGEPNSYNLVHADARLIRVERRDWDGTAFRPAATQEYARLPPVDAGQDPPSPSRPLL